MTFAVYMLAEHPEIADRLRKEVMDTVGGSKMPTYDDLRGMKYMRAFLNGMSFGEADCARFLTGDVQKH